MIDQDTASENQNQNHQKKVTMTLIGGRHWDVEFAGVITRRDIRKLNRVLAVEFSRVRLRRSGNKIVAAEAARVAAEKAKVKSSTTVTPTTIPKPPTKTKELTDAKRSS